MKKLISLAALMAALTGCVGSQESGVYGSESMAEENLAMDVNELNDSYLMVAAPKYYIGNAYKVDDVQYIPSEDLTYNQTGIAGIIPAELNGQKTTNGEVFDTTQMLATSKTLPLPTIAKVTNLDNGESVIVRVNNRGPFVNTRIMDLSPAAAEKIHMNSQAKVQVQVLTDASLKVKNATIGTNVNPEVVQPVVVEQQTVTVEQPAPAPVATGDYTVQLAAFYAEDSADAMANRMKTYGDAVVVNEGGMYKVRIINLDAARARSVINALRTNEGMAPGLLKNGRWINADSI